MNTEQVTITEEERKDIEAKIVHLLGIYPTISHTMLQGGLGPSLKPALWRPVLLGLIESGVVVEEHEQLLTPTNRHNNYTKLSLAE